MAGSLKARSPGLERPDTIIRKTIHHMGGNAEKKYYMHWVLWHWPEIVGDFIARNTSPQGIRKDTLYIYSDNSALRNELQMMMPQIVQSVNNYAGQKMIDKVAFSKRWEKSDSEGIDEIRLSAPPDDEGLLGFLIIADIQRQSIFEPSQSLFMGQELTACAFGKNRVIVNSNYVLGADRHAIA